MSKLQSKDFLNISCIVEDSTNHDGIFSLIGGKGYADYIDRAHPIIQKHKRAGRTKIGLGTLIGGGIGYYLGKNNEDTHSLHDILNHHYES
jgi:hypothetical protein